MTYLTSQHPFVNFRWNNAVRLYGFSIRLLGCEEPEYNGDFAEKLGIVLPKKPEQDKHELYHGLWVDREGLQKFHDDTALRAALGRIYPMPPNPLGFTLRYGTSWMKLVGGIVDDIRPEPPPIVEVSERDTYITAFRQWEYLPFGHDAALLESMNHRWAWPPGRPMEAKVMPKRENSSGVYAYPNEESARKHFNPCQAELLGEVALWGKVFQHEDGIYRAQYAYPLRIIVSNAVIAEPERVAQMLARTYGCATSIEQFFPDTEDDEDD